LSIDITDLREHIETDAVDDVLTRLLAQAQTDVEARLGTDAARTEVHEGGRESIRLRRPALSISSVSVRHTRSDTASSLLASDYEILHGGRTLCRTSWSVWEPIVTVVYLPRVEVDLRDMAIVELVRAALTYHGLISSEKVGDYSADLKSYTAERERILQQIMNHRGLQIR